jgi:transcriptional regulator with GAF, ATPase, and Fis domain
MLRLEQLELSLWREACRHIEIGEAADRFAHALREHFPLDGLLLCRLESNQSAVEVAAVSPKRTKHDPLPFPKTNQQALARLHHWIKRGLPQRLGPAHPASPVHAPLPLPPVKQVDSLLIPLQGAHGSVGLAILVATPGKEFNLRHEDLAKVVQEPLSVALDNDRQLHELHSLRAAAEADRISLLHRLGRTELADTIVGETTGLQQVMERVRMVQKSDVPTLILGETGTGKELVARSIHQQSQRHAGPFIRVNCGAIPSELLDSQLFGHEKGSFTGATDSRAGWFERADRGTLFLDEIGELPLDAQVRLLRVLQDGIIERVGGESPIHVDVRIVAATHRDLSQMVRDGRFREDLWYRLAVFPILLPPLRHRKEDIGPLVEHFAQKAAARFGLSPVKPKPEDLQRLQDYDWPGNIRELGTVIDRAAILGEGRTLDIPKALGFGVHDKVEPTAPRSAATPNITTDQTLDQAMRAHIVAVLHATKGKIEGRKGAAARLDINPHTLRARMRKLGIDWGRFRDE